MLGIIVPRNIYHNFKHGTLCGPSAACSSCRRKGEIRDTITQNRDTIKQNRDAFAQFLMNSPAYILCNLRIILYLFIFVNIFIVD